MWTFGKTNQLLCSSRLGTVHPGVICAVESSPDVFHRVQIERILAKDMSGNALKTQVKSLDEGWIRIFKVKAAFYLFYLMR